MLTSNEKTELALLRIANEHGKFAVFLDPKGITAEQQQALERLQLREWVRLIDVSYVGSAGAICRVFLASLEARMWVKQNEQEKL